MYNNRVENSPVFRVMTNTTNVVKPTYPVSQSNVNGLQGPQGIMGEIGYDGDDGVQGPQGNIGLHGLQGPEGVKGLHGLQGPEGVDGVQGNEGLQGPEGKDGLRGLQGPEGLIGQTFEKITSFTDTQMYVSDIPLVLNSVKTNFTNQQNTRILFVSINCEGNTAGEVTLEFNLKRKENEKENDFYPTMTYMLKKSSGAKVISLQFIDNHVITGDLEYVLYAKGKSTVQIKVLNSSIIVL